MQERPISFVSELPVNCGRILPVSQSGSEMANGQNDDARKDFLIALAVTAAISAAIIVIFDHWGAGSTISQGGKYALWGTFAALILRCSSVTGAIRSSSGISMVTTCVS